MLKKLTALILATGMVLGLLTGCSGGYRYVENGENSYVVLDTSTEMHDKLDVHYTSMYISFSTFEEMKSDIKSGRFTDQELKMLKYFPKNADGNIKTCNLSNLYILETPETIPVQAIRWHGESYTYMLKDERKSFLWYGELITESEYNRKVSLLFLHPEITYGVGATEYLPELNGDVYQVDIETPYDKYIQYEVGNNRALYVRETYIGHDQKLTCIEIYGTNYSQYFTILLQGTTEEPLTRLTVDELKAFGIREYRKTDAS